MAKSAINWTDEGWPVVTGCTKKNEACRNCWAARLAATRLKHHPRYKGLAGLLCIDRTPIWSGEVRCHADLLNQPLRWRKPRKVFVAPQADLFHSKVPWEFTRQAFSVMMFAKQHTFQVLTKREFEMRAFCRSMGRNPDTGQLILSPCGALANPCILPNVLLGVSIGNQKMADEASEPIQQLAWMGWKTWVSYEPALGLVDWTGWEFLSWMVSGGESGPGARPSHPDWHRGARDFCQAHQIPFFFKQWGEWYPLTRTDGIHELPFGDYRTGEQLFGFIRKGKKRAGRLLDGREWNEMPRAVASDK